MLAVRNTQNAAVASRSMFSRRRSLRTGSAMTSTEQPKFSSSRRVRSGETAEIGETALGRLRRQADHDIDIRTALRIATRPGAENRQAPDASRPEVGFVFAQDDNGVVAVHGVTVGGSTL